MLACARSLGNDVQTDDVRQMTTPSEQCARTSEWLQEAVHKHRSTGEDASGTIRKSHSPRASARGLPVPHVAAQPTPSLLLQGDTLSDGTPGLHCEAAIPGAERASRASSGESGTALALRRLSARDAGSRSWSGEPPHHGSTARGSSSSSSSSSSDCGGGCGGAPTVPRVAERAPRNGGHTGGPHDALEGRHAGVPPWTIGAGDAGGRRDDATVSQRATRGEDNTGGAPCPSPSHLAPAARRFTSCRSDNAKVTFRTQSIPAPEYVSDSAASDGTSSASQGAVSGWLAALHRSLLPPSQPWPELADGLASRSLLIFTLASPVRRACIRLISSPLFDRVSLLFILANCVCLALESGAPDAGRTARGRFLKSAELLFVIFFSIETGLKVLALGLYSGRRAYLRDSWNVVDFAIVVMGWLSYVPSMNNYSAMRSIRVLRPLRTITGVEQMRMLVGALLASLPMLLDVLLLCVFLFFIFGILAISVMAGSLRYRCGVPDPGTLTGDAMTNVSTFTPLEPALDVPRHCGDRKIRLGDHNYTFYSDGNVAPSAVSGIGQGKCPWDSDLGPAYCFDGGWESNPNFGLTSFDNILWAWLTIFQCASLEGWTDVMYAVQDAESGAFWIYFVVLIIFVSFFAVNLALAVLYLNFTQYQEAFEQAAKERLEQQHGDSAAGSDNAGARPPPYVDAVNAGAGTAWQRVRAVCHWLQGHPYFEVVTILLICINTITMASEHYGMPQWQINVSHQLNTLFTLYFTAEMVIKVLGLGFRGYVGDRMNAFDGAVVIASLVELLATRIGGTRNGALSIFRTFRLLRVFKLARQWSELSKIVKTIFESLSSIAWLSMLLVLFVFIMALLGMQMFGFQFASCKGADAFQICPLGMNAYGPDLRPHASVPTYHCPQHRDCYVECSEAQWGSWIEAAASPYNGRAFCERFPRVDASVATPLDLPGPTVLQIWGAPAPGDAAPQWQYLAQTGKAVVARHNFDTVLWSVITIFQILTGENWNTVMYDGMRHTHYAAALYFLFIVVVGNYIVLNLFLAILLDKFAGGAEPAAAAAEAQASLDCNPQTAAESQPSKHASCCEAACEPASSHSARPSSVTAGPAPASSRIMAYLQDSAKGALAKLVPGSAAKVHPRQRSNEHLTDDGGGIPSTVTAALNATLDADEEQHGPAHELRGRSLGVFGAQNMLRIWAFHIVSHPVFERVIIALILCSSITLAIDGPRLDPNGTVKGVLDGFDVCFVILFTLEALLRIVVNGLILGQGAYLRSIWNVIDFATVVISLILQGAGTSQGGLESLRSLRTLRALRPLRMASRAPGMKIVVNALIQSIPASGNVLLVCFLFYLIFGIMFVSLYKGAYDYCVSGDMRLDPDYYLRKAEHPMTREWCDVGVHEVMGTTSEYHASIPATSVPSWGSLESGNAYTLSHAWVKPQSHFDHIFAALLSLFEIATLELWLDFMYAGVDATGEDEQPRHNHNPLASLYFIAFVVVGSFFVLNLFVGVTIDKFNEMQSEHMGQNLLLTSKQEQWVAIQRLMARCRPSKRHQEPCQRARAFVFRIVMSDKFDAGVLCLVLLNVLCMALNHVDQPDALRTALHWLDVTFTAVFGLEAVAKVFALGARPYFRDPWCLFDFLVALLSVAQICLEEFSNANIPAIELLRVFRVARIFRLVPKAKGLRTLFQTLVFSLPALVNVGSVFFLFMFIFAIMGMTLFGQVRWGSGISRHANFETFPNALLVLFRMSTGESWNQIMHDCMKVEQCVEVLRPFLNDAGELVGTTDATGIWHDAGSPALSGASQADLRNRCGAWHGITIAYFLVFVILCAFLLLNLIIAVILDNFQNSSSNEELDVSQSRLLDFTNAWSRLDKGSTMFIPAGKLYKLLELVEHPLGVKGTLHAQLEGQKIIMTADIPVRIANGVSSVHFMEVLHALAGRIAGVQLPADESSKALARFSGLLPTDSAEVPPHSAAHYHAALHVQAAVRGFLARQGMPEKDRILTSLNSESESEVSLQGDPSFPAR